jgi:hypothetical protein
MVERKKTGRAKARKRVGHVLSDDADLCLICSKFSSIHGSSARIVYVDLSILHVIEDIAFVVRDFMCMIQRLINNEYLFCTSAEWT